MDRGHREQRDHDNLNEKESDCKVGMDFRSLSHHHEASDADVEVHTLIIISSLTVIPLKKLTFRIYHTVGLSESKILNCFISCICSQGIKFLVSLLQRDMDVDPSDRAENMHDDKPEKLARSFHSIGHHPAMVISRAFSNFL